MLVGRRPFTTKPMFSVGLIGPLLRFTLGEAEFPDQLNAKKVKFGPAPNKANRVREGTVSTLETCERASWT